MTFLGVFWAFSSKKNNRKKAPNPPNGHIANVSGGHRQMINLAVVYKGKEDRASQDCLQATRGGRKGLLPERTVLTLTKALEGQRNSRRLWRSGRRSSRSVPEGRADFPAVILLAGECPDLGSYISCFRKIGERVSRRVEIWRKTLPTRNVGQP